MSSATNNWFMDMKADNCGVFVDAYLAEYAFSRCHILSSSDNLYAWSIGINMPIPQNWPTPDFLKGEPLLLPHYIINIGTNNVWGRFGPTWQLPYSCPCRITNNSYDNPCHSIHNLK